MDNELIILHTADTHLGYRQYHSDVRRQDFFDAFSRVIDDAVALPADAVIHAGDFFDSRNPSLDDLIMTIGLLSKLKEAGIPFYGIVGNHEGKQNSQWLDLFGKMGLSVRLNEKPMTLTKDGADGQAVRVSICGIDNLSAPRLQNYDFSAINENRRARDNDDFSGRSFSLLVLHQLLDPVVPGQFLSVYDFLDRIDRPFDAVLLGDDHTYECRLLPAHSPHFTPSADVFPDEPAETWVTYPGSTERCSAAEEEPRSYNLIRLSSAGLHITRRNIPTRPFVVISASFEDIQNMPSDVLMREIWAKIDDRREQIPDAVVFLELNGAKNTLVSFAEIEAYILRCGAVVAKVSDRRDVYTENTEPVETVTFLDPDEVIRANLKKLNLTQAGFLADAVIRDPLTAKTRIDDETEERLRAFMETMSFDTAVRRSGPLVIDDAGDITADISFETAAVSAETGDASQAAVSAWTDDASQAAVSAETGDASQAAFSELQNVCPCVPLPPGSESGPLSVPRGDDRGEEEAEAVSENIEKAAPHVFSGSTEETSAVSEEMAHPTDFSPAENPEKKTASPRQYKLSDLFESNGDDR